MMLCVVDEYTAEIAKSIMPWMSWIFNVQNEGIPAWVVEEILTLKILLLRKK